MNKLKSTHCMAVLMSLLLASCAGNTDTAGGSFFSRLVDKVKNDSVTVFLKDNKYISFSKEFEGYRIEAAIEPDSSFSSKIGRISYILKRGGNKDTIETTYNHFYASLYGTGRQSVRKVGEKSFYSLLQLDEDVPFKFIDVDFDGVKEFLVTHKAKNFTYHEVFKIDHNGSWISKLDPPYNKILTGEEGGTFWNDREKTIKVKGGFDLGVSMNETYQLQSPGQFVCVERTILQLISRDSLKMRKWEMKGNQLELVCDSVQTL